MAPAIGTPSWLFFTLQHRTRYEHLWRQFRAGRPGSGGLLNLRTSLFAELRPSIFRLGAELLDSRAYLASDVTAPDTGHVNAIALLQGYVGLAGTMPQSNDDWRVQVGRMTMDVGSRRFVARNRFRNTINAFTGIELDYQREDGMRLRGFANLPIERQPTAPEEIRDNRIEFDRESFAVVFWGIFFASPRLAHDIQIEGYAFGLYERDADELETRNRRLATPGFRVQRPQGPGVIDFELESALQLGVSRGSTNDSDSRDLTHLALFQHAEVGYTLAVPLEPRLVAEVDYASGDADRSDGSNNRFDTLYGARRFDFGPTGILGTIARSNIRSPGARVQVTPLSFLDGFVGWRAIWLASARDSWTTSGVSDPTGAAGSFVGHQIEASVGVDPLPGNLGLEVGFAQLITGSFVERAPNANPASDTTYLYTQLSGQL